MKNDYCANDFKGLLIIVEGKKYAIYTDSDTFIWKTFLFKYFYLHLDENMDFIIYYGVKLKRSLLNVLLQFSNMITYKVINNYTLLAHI